MSKKRKKKRTAIWLIVALVLVTIPFCSKALVEPRAYFYLSQPTIYVTTSDSSYQARFLRHGAMQGATMTLIAGSEPGKKVIVGDIDYGDGYPKFETAYWSLDGTVIAARGYVGKGVKEFVFTHAYDYEKDKVIELRIYQQEAKSILENHKMIEELLKQNGGTGREIAKIDINSNAKRLSYAEWRKWDEILEQQKVK